MKKMIVYILVGLCCAFAGVAFTLLIASHTYEEAKEFAEKLKNLIYPQLGISTYEKGEAFHFCLDEIDDLVKEMEGGNG